MSHDAIAATVVKHCEETSRHMKIIERLYLAYYKYSIWNREHFNNKMYIHPRFDSIFFLSFFTISNVSSILKLLSVKPFITTHLFDCFLVLIVIVGFLLFHFERNSRHKEIIKKYDSPQELGKIEILGWSYTISTLIFFFITHIEIFE